ncbi:hypothetical protein [Paraliobacillus sediminis]|uniref:hypothetical protein n=1 Tax=Paraliobacillus sediminis TaxID=1885916 RepID=UPI000E3D2F0E|nr:hypothetical protein [Paraliobacillus sediminis]
MKKASIGIVAVLALALIIYFGITIFSGNENNNTDDSTLSSEEEQAPSEEQNDINEMATFTEETARDVMQVYRQAFVTLIDSADQDGLLSEFETINGVRNHFEEVMSEDLAGWMTDSYIEKRDGQIYLIAKDSPTWLAEDEDFQMEEIAEDHYKIIQEQENELIGHVEMTYHAKWREDKWIISEIETEQLDQQVSVEQKAEEIIRALANKEMAFISNTVHEEKGLLFSPYIYIEEDAITFEKNEVTNLLEDMETYLWGNYDGSGKPIEQTPNEYFEEFIDAEPLLDPDEVRVDSFEQRGNLINNIEDVFPEAKVIEFYTEGSDEYEGMDWSSINLVFEQNEHDIWKLVAIVTDQWTI